MCSREQHLKFLWPRLLQDKPFKRLPIRKSCNCNTGIWSHESNKCLLFKYYNEREALAEIKIFNLLMHSPRETGGIEKVFFRHRGPTDAEIVFGNCDCKKFFCNRHRFKTGWEKSRIDWLWKLEHLEPKDQLRYIWREQFNRKQLPKRPPIPSCIALPRTVKTLPRRIGCWSWFRHSCGYVSDTDSLQVDKSAISL